MMSLLAPISVVVHIMTGAGLVRVGRCWIGMVVVTREWRSRELQGRRKRSNVPYRDACFFLVSLITASHPVSSLIERFDKYYAILT
jgi:hypothetical protein